MGEFAAGLGAIGAQNGLNKEREMQAVWLAAQPKPQATTSNLDVGNYYGKQRAQQGQASTDTKDSWDTQSGGKSSSSLSGTGLGSAQQGQPAQQSGQPQGMAQQDQDAAGRARNDKMLKDFQENTQKMLEHAAAGDSKNIAAAADFHNKLTSASAALYSSGNTQQGLDMYNAIPGTQKADDFGIAKINNSTVTYAMMGGKPIYDHEGHLQVASATKNPAYTAKDDTEFLKSMKPSSMDATESTGQGIQNLSSALSDMRKNDIYSSPAELLSTYQKWKADNQPKADKDGKITGAEPKFDAAAALTAYGDKASIGIASHSLGDYETQNSNVHGNAEGLKALGNLANIKSSQWQSRLDKLPGDPSVKALVSDAMSGKLVLDTEEKQIAAAQAVSSLPVSNDEKQALLSKIHFEAPSTKAKAKGGLPSKTTSQPVNDPVPKDSGYTQDQFNALAKPIKAALIQKAERDGRLQGVKNFGAGLADMQGRGKVLHQ